MSSCSQKKKPNKWIELSVYLCLATVGVVFLWAGLKQISIGQYKDGFNSVMIACFSFSGASYVRLLFVDIKEYLFSSISEHVGSFSHDVFFALGVFFFILWLVF